LAQGFSRVLSFAKYVKKGGCRLAK